MIIGISLKQFKVHETLEADLLDNLDTIKILIDKNESLSFKRITYLAHQAQLPQVLDRNANSWIECKDKQGKVLDELKRKWFSDKIQIIFG